jgi:signal transduction histidine kinase
MRRVPIRLRVAGAFAVAMALVLVLTGVLLYVRLGSHLSVALDRQLRLRAQDLATLARESNASLADTAGNPFVEAGESYAQLLDSSGHVLDASPPLGSAMVLTPEEFRAARKATIFANRGSVPGLDEPSRLLATPLTRRGKRIVLVVGATREDRAETLSSLRTELLIIGPLALGLASLAGYVLVGLSLRPVESMRRRAEAISAETPGERLPVPETGDEVERLAETLNAMLSRLEEALLREREFVADAGHELRTPLALLRTELELALRHAETPEELREAVRSSSLEVDRLAQLADDLLLTALYERGKLVLRLEELPVDGLLRSVARRFEWRAQEIGRPITVIDDHGLAVPGDRIRLEQALGNLVDNALRYGGGRVLLSARPAGEAVELHVADEGPGFPPEFLEHAFNRFARPDENRSRGGSGLGLSIVRVIAEAHGGSAHVTNLATGVDAWLTLPSADGASEASGV